MISPQEANEPRHYVMLVVAIVIGLVGVYLRFFDFKYASAIANVFLVIGTGIALKAVFAIMK